jgi:hypothetical protein
LSGERVFRGLSGALVDFVAGAAQQEITVAATVIPFIVSAESAAYMVRGAAILPRIGDMELLSVVRNLLPLSWGDVCEVFLLSRPEKFCYQRRLHGHLPRNLFGHRLDALGGERSKLGIEFGQQAVDLAAENFPFCEELVRAK